jgi:hypothetical protein
MIRRASAESQAMSDPASDVDEAVCWQCGAPADPHCAPTVVLGAGAGEHKDGQGYPMVRGYWQDVVRVRVPRCEGCRNRYWLVAFLFLTSGLVGMVFGGVEFLPSWGWMTIVGGFMGFVTVALGFVLYERLSGRRSINTYPPVQRLRQAGWKVVD